VDATGPGVTAGGVSGAEPPEPDPEPEPPDGVLGGVEGATVEGGTTGPGELSSGSGAGLGFGSRGGGETGNDLPATAGSTWPVTHTGVWSLDEE
jgi:hypothetical protein